MSKKAIGLLVLLVAVIVVVVLVVTNRNGEEVEVPVEDRTEEREVMRIDALHTYDNGVHTVAGRVNLPTPCDLLETEVEVSEDESDTTIMFSVINETEEGEVCAQVVTANPFKVNFEANEDADILATFRGGDAILNLIPADQEEIDAIEIYTKG